LAENDGNFDKCEPSSQQVPNCVTKVPENGDKAENGASSRVPSHSSVYRQKHREQINEVRQPVGFDASLASQVVARAQKFGKKFNFLQKEEVFGSD
jgi:hypothetical protein